MESECDPAGTEAAELMKCLHAGIIPDAYKDSIEDIEVVGVRRKPDEAKKKSDPQNSTRPFAAMKEPSFHYEKRKKVRFKLRPNREKMDKRKCTSEHPFGTIKRWHDSGYFLLKGIRKVDGEFALFSIGCNLSRAENMFTFNELMERAGRKAA